MNLGKAIDVHQLRDREMSKRRQSLQHAKPRAGYSARYMVSAWIGLRFILFVSRSAQN